MPAVANEKVSFDFKRKTTVKHRKYLIVIQKKGKKEASANQSTAVRIIKHVLQKFPSTTQIHVEKRIKQMLCLLTFYVPRSSYAPVH